MHKRLYRSGTDKMIGGVAGGLARYFEVDPVIIRAVFIISTIAWGVSLLAYIVLWIIVPVCTEAAVDDGKAAECQPPAAHRRKDKKVIFGAIFITVGIFILMGNIFPFLDFDVLIAIVLVTVGIYLLLKKDYKKSMEELNENG